jgi:hypothetical protein
MYSLIIAIIERLVDDAKMQDRVDVQHELLDAMTMVAKSGKGPESQMATMGCSIKWR